MSYTEYQKAQKLGEKTYKSCISKGSYPYLPVLADMLSKEKSESQISLGLVEIPIELITGTYTSGRTTAFSYDFMPLLEPETEFGSKWSALYDSLCDEGQRDPIVAYEYLNRFYVVEGNKRVSVQKYMGAVTIEGNVTRIIPQKDDTKENKIYFEFLDFYSKTKINYILMSNEGNYEHLFRQIHPDSSQPLTEEEQLEFKFVYSLFKKEYYDRGGHKLHATIGDVLLAYIEIFGYEDIKKKSSCDIKKDIIKIWSEFKMLSEDNPVSLLTHPTEQSQKISITKLIPVGNQPLKVAFVNYKEPKFSGWSYGHELGREHISNVFGERIQTESFYTYNSSDIELLENIISDGYKLIFTTTPVLSSISLKCAVLHPEVIILNCSINNAFRHLRSYYLRIYEAKFIIGAIAGSLTESDSIGYIADYPIFGMPASVNAFALGVKLVNPRARIYLEWSTMKNHNPYETFKKYNVDLISNKDINAPVLESREFGLYGLYGDTRFNIAMPVWNWGRMYEELIRSVINGGWKNDDNTDSTRGLNYYWGMSSGAIDVICSQKMPLGIKQLVKILKNQITEGQFNPFSEKIYSQNGTLMNNSNDTMLYEDIINIDWFADNITGKIPDISELEEGSHELIRQLGIKHESNTDKN
jgi:basic membrane lipoprotein Med (substrate-binding protein (PBP1-ABC) superfamily)